MANVTLVDNYDSFTWNLYHHLGALGAAVTVVRNDAISVEDLLETKPEAVVLSPGPRTPRDAGICLNLLKLAAGTVPILGVCLGHQAIGDAYGGNITRAPLPMHGKLSTIHHQGEAVFHGINGPFRATRYHSLVIDDATLPNELLVTARADDGVIMGVSHRTHPVHGVQFHPESISSEYGQVVFKNFLAIASAFRARSA